MAAHDFTTIGSRFSRLVVTSEYWSDKFHIKRVRCICDCGTETEASCQQLVKGTKKSCGCLRRETSRKLSARAVANGGAVPINAGSRFGKLSVLTGEWIGSGARRKVRCACDCGAEKDVAIADLRGGKTTSCGCYKREWQEERIAIPIGDRFGKLVVLHSAPRVGRDRMVEAQCDCGALTRVTLNNLRSGHTASCGCLRSEVGDKIATHGHARKSGVNRTYAIYRDMRTRCENPKYREFHLYGGRGITVCERWKNGYEFFLADMGERPTGMSLERKRVNEGYSPDNCKWATDEEQANNKRNNVFIEFEGRRMTIAQWSRELGLKAGTVYFRHSKGWPPERILSPTP